MKSKIFFCLLYTLFAFITSCSSSKKEDISPDRLPNGLFYFQNEVFICQGVSFQSSEGNIKGDFPMEFSISTDPVNPKITIDKLNGKISVTPDAPIGIFKVNVKVRNAFGSQDFNNVITIYSSKLDMAGVGFNKDVRPLVQSKCDPCHTTGGGKDWTNSNNTKKYILKIIEKTSSGEMPQGEPRLTDLEIKILKDWMNNCFLD